MKTIQALAFLMIPLILVTSCAPAESPGYPTIAEINELLENNRELFTRTSEILRGHPDFFRHLYEETGQWGISSLDEEWIAQWEHEWASFSFDEAEIETIRSVMKLQDLRDLQYEHFAVPMSSYPYQWETSAPAILFTYRVQAENGSSDLYQLCYVRADDSGTEEEQHKAVEEELGFLQRFGASLLELDVNGWYGIGGSQVK